MNAEDVAAQGMHQADCGCAGFTGDDDGYYLMLAKAALDALRANGYLVSEPAPEPGA